MALNINGAMPVEVKNVDSLVISSVIMDNDNGRILIVYKKLSGTNVVSSDQVVIEGDDFIAMVTNNLSIYAGIKNVFYDAMMSKLGIVGDIV